MKLAPHTNDFATVDFRAKYSRNFTENWVVGYATLTEVTKITPPRNRGAQKIFAAHFSALVLA